MSLSTLALIEARGIGVQVLDATTAWLADETRRDAKLTPRSTEASTVLLRALMWNVFLSCRLGREISKATVSGLRVKMKYAQGAPTDEEKDILRALALPEKTAALFKARFYL